MAPSSPLSPAAASAASARGAGGHVAVAARASCSKPPFPKRSGNKSTQPAKTLEPSLAHQAALQRSSSKPSSSHIDNKSQQPVLVHPAPPPSNSPTMRNRAPKSKPHPQVPDPTAFTFTSILSSLGPEGDAAIGAIAEICGKSNMSLADEHNLHLPPHGQVSALGITRLEPTAEEERAERRGGGGGGGVQTRSMTRRQADRSGSTAATTVVNVRGQRRDGEADGKGGMLPQVLAWLRGARGRSREEDGAVRNLRGLLLDEPEGMRS